MKKYLKHNGVRLAIVVVIAALIVGLAARSGKDGLAGPLPSAANSLRIPVQGAVGSVVDWLRGIYGYIYQYDKLVRAPKRPRKTFGCARCWAIWKRTPLSSPRAP